MRLLGFERIELRLGDQRHVAMTADPRLLARYDDDAGQWHITGRTYKVVIAKAADDPLPDGQATLNERRFGS